MFDPIVNADAAKRAYDNLALHEVVNLGGKSFVVDHIFENSSGLAAFAFRPLNSGSSSDRIIAFRGTELSIKDWYGNFAHLGRNQYEASQAELTGYARSILNSKGHIDVAGHSLGGGLAQYLLYDLASIAGISKSLLGIFTFNGLGGAYGLREAYGSAYNPNLTAGINGANYMHPEDVVSGLSNFVAGVVKFIPDTILGPNGIGRAHARDLFDKPALDNATEGTRSYLATDQYRNLVSGKTLIDIVGHAIEFATNPSAETASALFESIRALPVVETPATAIHLLNIMTQVAAEGARASVDATISTLELIKAFTPLLGGNTSPELQAKVDEALTKVQEHQSIYADIAIKTFSSTAAAFATDGDELAAIGLDIALRTGLEALREAAVSVVNVSAIEGIREGHGLLSDVTGAIWTGMGVDNESLMAEFGSNVTDVVSSHISAALKSALLKAIADENAEGLSQQALNFLADQGSKKIMAALGSWATGGFGDAPEFSFSLPDIEVAKIINDAAGSMGTALGSKIARGIISIDSLGEELAFQVGAAVGGALGSTIGTSIGTAAAQQLAATYLTGLLFPGVGTLIGAVAGSFAGGVVGEFVGDWLLDDVLGIELDKLFGDDGRFQYHRWYVLRNDEVVFDHDWWKDVPGKVQKTVNEMSETYMSMMNAYIDALGGHVSVDAGGMLSKFAWNTDQKLHVGLVYGGEIQSYDPSYLIERAVASDMDRIALTGADPVIARAFAAWQATNWTDDSKSLTELTRMLETAQSYRAYLDDPGSSNTILATAPTSALAVDILSKLYSVVEFGLDLSYVLNGDAGDNLLKAADGNDQISGGAGADRLVGYGGVDRLDGGEGNDTLVGGSGNDIIEGGAGVDVLVLSERMANYYFDYGTSQSGPATVTHLDGGIDGIDTLSGIERIKFLDGEVDLSAVLPKSRFSITSTQGQFLEGAPGGSRTILFTITRTGDTTTTQSVSWGVSGSSLSTDDFMQVSSNPADHTLPFGLAVFAAGEKVKTIGFNVAGDSRFEQDDSFKITLSSPTNDAKLGTDSTVGFIMNDDALKLVSTIRDFVVKQSTEFSYVVKPAEFSNAGADVNLYYTATRSDGSSLPDWLIFDPFTKTFSGTPQAGDTGKISVKLTAGVGDQSVSDVFTITVESNGHLVRGNSGRNVLNGTAARDQIEGLGGNDKLSGRGGADTLVGGTGTDALFGGGGPDTFVFRTGDTSLIRSRADVIHDFRSGDRIDLSGWDADSTLEDVQSFNFIGTARFGGNAGELRYAAQRGDTWVEGDVDGDGRVDMVIKLEGTVRLTAGDFVL